LGRVAESWFESFDVEGATNLANDFRIMLTFAKSHEILHRILEGYLKEGILSIDDRKSFYEACQRLTGVLDKEDSSIDQLKNSILAWTPSSTFYSDVETTLRRERLFIPNQDFRLLMGTGFSFAETQDFVRRVNLTRRDFPINSAPALLEVINPRSFHELTASYLGEVAQEFVVGGSPRSFEKIGRILEVLGGGLIIAANVASASFAVGEAAASVGGGLVAVGDGLRRG
jgi:hypothetical protein